VSDGDLKIILLKMDHMQLSIDQLQSDFRDEKDSARDSRAVVHRRLDEQVEKIHELSEAAAVDAVSRDALTKRLDGMEPTVFEWKRIRAVGIGIGGLLAIGGLSLGSILLYAGEAFWTWVRHKLGVS
jgi:hypothetical protein